MPSSSVLFPFKLAVAALAFTFPLTYTAATTTSRFLFHSRSLSSSYSAFSTTPTPKSLACDLLSLLGSPSDAARVDPSISKEIWSCLKFLVPFSPNPSSASPRFGIIELVGDGDAMMWWPPQSVMEIARIAVDSEGDPAALQRELDPTMLQIPDVEGLKKDKCELTRTPYGRRFVSKEMNSYLAFLFEMIVSRGPSVGLNVSLSRYDLFHGHMFLATNSGRLGILFHAKEYPAYETEAFPINLGYCQTGSNIAYDNDTMNLRNILWLAPLPGKQTKAWEAPGVLVVLDAHPGGIIYKSLVPEYVNYVRTIYEDDFGENVADINYLNVNNASPEERIFIC